MIGEVGTVAVASHLDLAAALTAAGQRVDALIVDAPYSTVTHAGHDAGVAAAPRMLDFAGRGGGAAKDRTYAARKAARGETHRRAIDYPAWAASDVEAFVDAWAPLTSGWFVSITDDELAHTWKAELRNAGLYVFAPIPLIETGGRVRLRGDGPSSWACWVIVARPMSGEWLSEWMQSRRSSTLRGLHEGNDDLDSVPAYYRQASEEKDVVGGKPLRAMKSIVADYSLPGQVVCDPCCGGGPALVAAKMSGRRWIGGDCDAAHVEIARKRLDETTPCDARGTPIGGAKGKSEAFNWGDE